MFNLKFTYPIGIDIRENEIYAAQLKQTRNGLALRGTLHRELNGEAHGSKDDALLPLLKEISKSRLFFGKRVAVHLPSESMISFPIRFQVEASESLEEAILRKSGEYLSFPIEQAVIDYPSLVSTSTVSKNEYKAIIIASPRDQIEMYISLLRRAGLTLEMIDFVVCSLIRLHYFLHSTLENPVMLCHIGSTQSILCVVTKEGILAERTIPWGIRILLKKIMTNLGLNNEKHKAELLLKRYGLVYEDRRDSSGDTDIHEDKEKDNIYRAIYQIITPSIEELIEEFHRMIGYLRSEERNAFLEGIYIYGQGALIHHLGSYIEGRLNIPTELIDPGTKSGMVEEGLLIDGLEGAPFALALGLAMRKVSWL